MNNDPSKSEPEPSPRSVPTGELRNPEPLDPSMPPAPVPPDPPEPALAAHAGADYEIIRRIGRGAYGEVYLARDSSGAYRAVKVIFRESFENDRPFEREFEGICKFMRVAKSYDNQVQIFHVGRREQPKQFYYIMELADDEARGQDVEPQTYVPKTLRSELKRRGHLPAKECLSIGVGLTRALESLHENGLIHRDIKPANIIFVRNQPKLADLGLLTDAAVTISYVGTEGFIAPEGPGSAQADLYGLGKVLYEISTGRDRLEYPLLPADFAELPDRQLLLELNAIIARACERDPRERYHSAREMCADLLAVQRGGSVRRRRARRRMLIATAVLALVLSLVGVVGLGAYHILVISHCQTRFPVPIQLLARDRQAPKIHLFCHVRPPAQPGHSHLPHQLRFNPPGIL